MAILAGDIKLVKSQVMLDTPEGGGAPTAEIIEDAVSNSLFPDISELDRAGGRVNLRKVHATVQSDNTDGYYGANMIVAEPPEDPLVNITLFTTDSTFDRREDAKSRIESYLAFGSPFGGYLFGNHLAGQMTVTLLDRTEASLPVVGATLVLIKGEGLTTEVSQFVRVTTVAATTREFEDDKGTFTRQEITLGVSDTLRYDFAGFDATRFLPTEAQMQSKTRVRNTVVANAARYYGVTPIADAVTLGDFTVSAESIFTQLVPSAQVETPIADARLNQQSAALVAAGSALTINPIQIFDASHDMFVGGGILPGSLSVVRDGITLVDSGGTLLNSATLAQVGIVDYSNGVLSLTTAPWGASGGVHTVVFTPATSPTLVTKSFGLPVTIVSQRLTWVTTLEAVPAKRSLQVSYRAQGRWYVLTEDGSGALRGTDSSYGIGSINFSTGTVSLTLGALPDVGSQILFAWAPAVTAPKLSLIPNLASEASLVGKTYARLDIGVAIKPNTLAITWNDGAARSAFDNGAGGLTGYATGTVDYATGVVLLVPTSAPAVNTTIAVAITEATRASASVTSLTDMGANWQAGAPSNIRPGAFSASMPVSIPSAIYDTSAIGTAQTRFSIYDDGAGAVKMAHLSGTVTIGSINYTTGVLSISKSITGIPVNLPKYKKTTIVPPYALSSAGGAPSFSGETFEYVGMEVANVTVTVFASGANPLNIEVTNTTDIGAQSYNFPLTELRINGSPSRFHIGSNVYVTSNDSTDVILNPASTTGVGTVAGQILNRTSVSTTSTTGNGITAISQWPTGASPTLSYVSGNGAPPLSGASTTLTVDCAMFRTAVAPLRNGSFSVAGTWPDGATFTATSDSNGNIATGSAAGATTAGSFGVFGKVDYEPGVVQLRFGRRVPDAWAGTEPNVIDLSYLEIPGVKYVQSQGVQADTLRYNASAYTYLPLDADILGIDPVRLPSDGRVPIFKPGDFAVLGHSAEVGPITVSNGQTVNCGRVRLSRVRIIDANGQVINTGYSANLEAGLVTFSSVTGYAQPIKIEHRIEDMMLVRDAQISGDISFTRPVTHDYPLGSYISSALVAGDLVARVSTLFDQATWTNVWSETVIGSPATGTYNDVLSPIEVTNVGALTERWAIRFTNTTAFEVIGEHVGVIATGNTSSDLSPTNPATGQPYFTLRAIGWGSGWSTNNVLRFNTVGCQFPVWVVRTVQQGPETVINDSFTLLTRGDVDRP